MIAADLISVACFFPVVIITRLTGLWSHFGPSWCSVFFTSFRYTAMFLLSFDRFNMVFFPFTYPLQGNKIMVPITILVWIISLLIPIIPFFIQCYVFQLHSGFCTVSASCSQVCYAYRLLLDSVSYIAGAVVPIILYSLMYLRFVQLKKKVAIMVAAAAADESNRRARASNLFVAFCFPNGMFFTWVRKFYIAAIEIKSRRGVLGLPGTKCYETSGYELRTAPTNFCNR